MSFNIWSKYLWDRGSSRHGELSIKGSERRQWAKQGRHHSRRKLSGWAMHVGEQEHSMDEPDKDPSPGMPQYGVIATHSSLESEQQVTSPKLATRWALQKTFCQGSAFGCVWLRIYVMRFSIFSLFWEFHMYMQWNVTRNSHFSPSIFVSLSFVCFCFY